MNACDTHPTALARYRCAECSRLWCPGCVEPVVVGEVTAFRCACGAACAELEVDEGDTEAFFARLPGTFRFPATRRGLAMLAAGALYFAVADRIFVLPLVGQLFLFVGIAFGVSYLMQVALLTAQGQAEAGLSWPLILDPWEELVRPLLRFIGLALLVAGPAAASRSLQWPAPVTALLAAFALFYGPMAFMGVAVFGTLTALSPGLVIPSILRIPRPYLVSTGLVVVIAGVLALAEDVFTGGVLGTVGTALARFVALYLAVVEVRILGLLYRAHRDQLAWF